jgi:hypothetical protein
VRSFVAGAFGGDEALFDTRDKFVGILANLVLLARCGELQWDVMALPVEFERRKAREDAIELLRGALGQYHHELVGVEMNGKVGASNDGTHPGAEFAQSLVSGVATEAIIDRTELLEIEHDERKGMTHALGAGDFGGETLFGEATVVKACKLVDHRLIAEAVELRLLVGQLSAQLLDQKFLADRVHVEKNDQRDESENGLGEANFEKGADALVGCDRGESDDGDDKQHADEDRIAAEVRVALLDQRHLLLDGSLTGFQRGWNIHKITIRSAHIEIRGTWPRLLKIRVRKYRVNGTLV